MAQVLAVPGDVRHGFSYKGKFNHDFSRITGIAATMKGNLLLCDHNKKNLILVDPLGNYFKKLDVDSEPYEVVIISQNIGCITQPNSKCVVQIDPDRMIVLFKTTCDELNTTLSCVSALPNTGRISQGKNHFQQHCRDLSKWIYNLFTCCKVPCSQRQLFLFLYGQNYITYKTYSSGYPTMMNIATMDTPTDRCSDDNGHIYVSGQDSNNIHRLVNYITKLPFGAKSDCKVIDIPLDSQHGIKEPVALCFNKDYSKLYIVNEWGKSVLVFDAI
ncbi:unnamed protein product [Mytilus edulis]|uniref:Uncharacterized protein n=1 Tax=Mytilus edulis TaxID=6550 RepID=A0A8S3TSA3_MYTED|nr:unnamed protein product [Mytilus edulis]